MLLARELIRTSKRKIILGIKKRHILISAGLQLLSYGRPKVKNIKDLSSFEKKHKSLAR